MRKIVFLVSLVLFAIWCIPAYADQPAKIKGVYYGSNAFGAVKVVNGINSLLENTEINTVVIDKKDDDGKEYTGAYFQKLISGYRTRGAYIVCRVVALKDNSHVKVRPDLYLKSVSNPSKIWRDNSRSQNAFLDPDTEDAAEYIKEVSLRAIEDGCDMINYDYIRLPSGRDGNTADTKYPPTLENRPKKRAAMRAFLKELTLGVREKHPHAVLAASIFGYACYGSEPGVGQYLDDFVSFGFIISCMAYPSHYDCNDEASDPNKVPYKIYRKTILNARSYLKEKGFADVTMLPWLQGFTWPNINGCGLGPDKNGKIVGKRGKKGDITEYEHDPARFREQIRALNELGIESWLVWHSGARYSEKLFLKK